MPIGVQSVQHHTGTGGGWIHARQLHGTPASRCDWCSIDVCKRSMNEHRTSQHGMSEHGASELSMGAHGARARAAQERSRRGQAGCERARDERAQCEQRTQRHESGARGIARLARVVSTARREHAPACACTGSACSAARRRDGSQLVMHGPGTCTRAWRQHAAGVQAQPLLAIARATLATALTCKGRVCCMHARRFIVRQYLY